jgi:hypothetical protein
MTRGAKDRGRDQRECVVDMDDIGRVTARLIAQGLRGGMVPRCRQTAQHLAPCAHVADRIAVAGKGLDGVPRSLQQRPFAVDDDILPRRSGATIVIVDL